MTVAASERFLFPGLIAVAAVVIAMALAGPTAPGDITENERDLAAEITDQIFVAHNHIWETGEFPEQSPEIKRLSESSEAFRAAFVAEMAAVLAERNALRAEGFELEEPFVTSEPMRFERAGNGGVQVETSVTWNAILVDESGDQTDSGYVVDFLIVLPPEATNSRARTSKEAKETPVSIKRIEEWPGDSR